jgi:hypothetical protein
MATKSKTAQTDTKEAIRAKAIADLENMVAIQSTPGKFNVNPYMYGYANGLILALATVKGDECVFLPPPQEYLADAPKAADVADPEAVNGFDEEFLVGLWLADQRAAGAKTVDLEKVEIIREGIRYALELRTPA